MVVGIEVGDRSENRQAGNIEIAKNSLAGCGGLASDDRMDQRLLGQDTERGWRFTEP